MAMKPRRLTSPSEIIDALGGNGPVAELTGSKPKTVSMWRTFDTLPTKTFLILDRVDLHLPLYVVQDSNETLERLV